MRIHFVEQRFSEELLLVPSRALEHVDRLRQGQPLELLLRRREARSLEQLDDVGC
jgi:hypothetical protein